MADFDPATHLTGWLGVDQVQQSHASKFPALAQAAPHLMAALPEEPTTTLLYRAFREVLGSDPPYPAQQIGDCVSFGHGHANDLLQCVEIALLHGDRSWYRETDTEFIYGESRKVAGILGPFDGSYGSAAVKAMTKVGVVSREMLGGDGAYSGKRAKSWGRTGPPANVETMAAPYKLGAAALVKTWDELVAAMTNGYPVTICSNQGFTMTRDQQGFCRASGHWGHCMHVGGIRFDRPGACILQSWGPTTPGGPTSLDQPSFSFWAERSAIEHILSAGDSWALSRSPQFTPRVIPSHWKYASLA